MGKRQGERPTPNPHSIPMKPLLILCLTLLLSPVWAQPEKAAPLSPWRWGINLQAGHNYPRLAGGPTPYDGTPLFDWDIPKFEISVALGAESFVEYRLAQHWRVRTGVAFQYLLLEGRAGAYLYNLPPAETRTNWLAWSIPLEGHFLLPVGNRGDRLRLHAGLSALWYPGGATTSGGWVNEAGALVSQITLRPQAPLNLGMQGGLAWELPLGSHYLSLGAKAHLARFRQLVKEVRVMEATEVPLGTGTYWEVGETVHRYDWRVTPTTLSFELGFLF